MCLAADGQDGMGLQGFFLLKKIVPVFPSSQNWLWFVRLFKKITCYIPVSILWAFHVPRKVFSLNFSKALTQNHKDPRGVVPLRFWLKSPVSPAQTVSDCFICLLNNWQRFWLVNMSPKQLTAIEVKKT